MKKQSIIRLICISAIISLAVIGFLYLSYEDATGTGGNQQTSMTSTSKKPPLEPSDANDPAPTTVEPREEQFKADLEELLARIIVVDAMSASVEEADRVAKALEEWMVEKGLSPEEFYWPYFHLLKDSHPDWMMRLGIRMDPEGTGISAQGTAIRFLAQQDVTLTLDLITKFGPSGKGLKDLVDPCIAAIAAADPKAFLSWLTAERGSEVWQAIVNDIDGHLGRAEFPESVRLVLMRDESMPSDVRLGALREQARVLSQRVSPDEYHVWANNQIDLLTTGNAVKPILASWPPSDFAGAEKFLGNLGNSEIALAGWTTLTMVAGKNASPEEVADILSRAPAGFKNNGAPVRHLYDRDPEMAITALDLLDPSSDVTSMIRYEMFIWALVRDGEQNFLERVMAMETNPEQLTKMKERFANERGK